MVLAPDKTDLISTQSLVSGRRTEATAAPSLLSGTGTISPEATLRPQIVQVSAPPEALVWIRPVIARINHLFRLPPNWDSYGGRPMAVPAANTALAVLVVVMRPDCPAPNVAPIADGGLELSWNLAGVDLEIFCSPTGTCRALFEDLRGEFPPWESDLGEDLEPIAKALGTIVRRKAP